MSFWSDGILMWGNREVTGVTGGSGQPWWSDALNDPWRDPGSEAVVVRTAPVAEPPPPPFPTPAAQGVGMRSLVLVALITGLLAGAMGGALGYVAATSREKPITLGNSRGDAPPAPFIPGSLPAMVPLVMPSVVTVSAASAQGAVPTW